LSTEPYKGVRDFYPADMAIQKYIFDVWKKTAESFGYEEYGASVLEPADMYKAKSGDEIVNEQTYTFIDRGEREVTLRPEMTPTLARMVAAKKRELVFPLRWYSIPNLFRYEQPQRGRVREHWQLNVDLFGVDDIEADSEVISLAYKVMKNFGAKDGDFEIRINDSSILVEILSEKLGKGKEETRNILKIIDKKKNKIPADEFKKLMIEKYGKEVFEKLDFYFNDQKAIDEFISDKRFEKLKAIKASLVELAKDTKNTIPIKLYPYLTRGFDYYTGLVFEIYDTNPENRRALFGGGRYDDLCSLFGGDKIPAVGFGMGDVTIRDWLETRGLLPKTKAPADYYICVMSEGEAAFAEKTAENLRAKGSRVAIDFTYKKIGDQIKSADKRGIPNVIVIGPEEAKSGKLKVKNLTSGEEKEL
jgi:histidyl-tRNA synthetase